MNHGETADTFGDLNCKNTVQIMINTDKSWRNDIRNLYRYFESRQTAKDKFLQPQGEDSSREKISQTLDR